MRRNYIESLKKVISPHGVYNVLLRNGLNRPEKRFVYAESRTQEIYTPQAWTDRVRTVLEQFIPSLAPAPPPVFTRLLKPFFISALFTFIALFGTRSWIYILGGATSSSHAIGLVFASIALLMGSFFFAYSMKYYLTLAIVLSFSQQEGETGLSGRGKKGFLYWLLGIANGNGNGPSTNSGIGGNGRSKSAVGLEPNLEHIRLKKHPYVSVHIPFYNEKNVVERAMAASTNFDYKGEYEVILCDDSTDETTEMIRKYQEKHLAKGEKLSTITNKEEGWTLTSVEVKPGVTLKHLHRTSRSGFKGGVLKLALTLVDPRTEFISVFDADFVPYPDTLELFLKYFKVQNEMKEDYTNSNVAVVQGYQWHVLNKSENWITRGIRNEYAGSYVIERSGQEIYGGLKHISGSVYMIRRKPLEEVGWDTSITEDYELTLKLYEKGYKVVYTPYIQAPAECVSTLKRLIKQRMRWSEGHSHNVRKMWRRLLFNSKLTVAEKVEFLYNMPYYLQACFFLIGTFSWLISETIFPARLPFWTTLWGWSLVLTNILSLPLVNAVGLFLEESEQKDYQGIPSFIALSYIMVPFQAYASVKGFLEKEEGPWFRTPKTGKITDVFARGKFYRFISGILPGRANAALQMNANESMRMDSNEDIRINSSNLNSYLSLATANNRFNTFNIKSRKQQRWVGRLGVSLLLLVSTTLVSFAPYVSVDNNPQFTLPGAGIIQPAGKRSENTKDNKDSQGFSFVREAKAATNDVEDDSNTYIDTSFRLRTEGLELKGDKKGFQKYEDPEFSVKETKGLVERIKAIFKKEEKEEGNLSVRVIDNNTGREIQDVDIKKDQGVLTINVDADELRPGKYSIIAQDNEGHGLLQDFTWGVLALNTNKSIYVPEETVNVSFAVLDEKGGTECNAELSLSIKKPNGDVLNLSTEKGTIVKNGGCGHKGMILLPDYETFFQTGDSRNIGIIELSLTAETQNGKYSIEDMIEVREWVEYDIERLSATRLYPPLNYPMIFTVTANEDYEGIIVEEIPASFNAWELSEEEMQEYLGENPKLGLQEFLGVKEARDKKMIEWFVNWEKGKTYNFGYWYKAPAVSPALFLLGKLKIGDFKEARYWQLANDLSVSYTEKIESWQESSTGWQPRDLATYGVPANAVAEIAVGNAERTATRTGGVRAVGSGLSRYVELGEAEAFGEEYVVMHVQTDSGSDIQAYASDTNDITFYLLGYWSYGTYVEKMVDIPPGGSGWQPVNLSGQGLSASDVAEFVLTNSSVPTENLGGVRENGGSLSRLVDIHEAENNGVSTATMLVQADNTANAAVEVYEENESTQSSYLVGYWSTPPGLYTEKFETITDPTSDNTWTDKDLNTSPNDFGVPGDAVTEIIFAQSDDNVENLMGARENGTSLDRRLEMQEAEGGGSTLGRMHTNVDTDSILDINHDDISDTPFEFHLMGYWELFNVQITGNIYQSGSESTPDTTAYDIYASVNNAAPMKTTASGGSYSIDVLASSGDSIAVYIYSDTNDATTFTVSDGSTDISDLHLYVGRVAVGNNNSGSTTNANICNQSIYPTGSTPDDKLLSCDGSNNVTVEDNVELHVMSSKTYAPGANLITGGTGDLHLDDSSYFTGAGIEDHQIANDVTIDTSAVLTAPSTEDDGTIKVGGSWDNSGTFTEGTGEVIFTATSGTEAINNSTSDFYDLTLGETSGTAEWDVTSNLDVDGDLTLAYGTLDINTSNTLNAAGLVQFDSGTTYSKSTGAFTFDGTGSHNYTDSTAGIQNLGDVTIDAESGTRTVSLQTDMEMDNLTIEADGVFAMGTNDVTIGNTTDASSGDINVTSGGSSSQSASGTVTVLSNSGTTEWNGTGEFDAYDFTIGNSSNTFTIDNDNESNDLALDVANDFTITANTTYQASSTGKLEVGNNFVNSGTFTKNESTVTMDGQDSGNQVTIGTDSFYNLTFNDAAASGTFSFTNSSVTVSNDFTITGGSVTAPSTTLYIGHDFTNDDIFSNNTATVDFNAASDSTHTISGTTATTTFNNLTITNDDKTIVFGATKSYTISGVLTMSGTDCLNFIVIRSTVKDSAATITNTVSLSFIDSQDITYGSSSSASSSADSGGNTNISIAANACIGASTDSSDTATGHSFQRKTFYVSGNDDYWLFYHDGDEIEVRYSADSGSTWNVENDHLAHDTNDFSIWNATVTSNYVFMAVVESNDIVVRRGTISDGSISWDTASPYVIALDQAGSETYSYPFISVDSGGYLWVGARFFNGSSSYSYKTVKSSNTADSTWTQAAFTWGDTYQISQSQASANVYGNIVPLASNNMYATFTVGTELQGCKWVNSEPDWQDSSSESCTESLAEQYFFRDEGADVLDDTATDPRKEINTTLGSSTQTETIDTTNRSFYILTDNANTQWTNDNLVTTNTTAEKRQIDSVTDTDGNTVSVWADSRNSGSLGTFLVSGTATYGRSSYTSAFLPDGRVLLIGANGGDGFSINELYDPATGTYTLAGTMIYARNLNDAVLLNNGRVLITGAASSPGYSINEIYDPATGTYTLAGTMNYARDKHNATLLNDGRVLIHSGGGSGLSISEIYDPATGTYSITGTMNHRRSYVTKGSALLPDGRVFIAGAYAGNGVSTAEIYDPATGTYSFAGTMSYERRYFTSTVLNDGRIFIAGADTFESSGYSINELYDPATGTFTIAGTMNYGRDWHFAHLLPNGKVFLAGERGNSSGFSISEIYDPETGTYSISGTLSYGRDGQNLHPLFNGQIFIPPGGGGGDGYSISEIYNPVTNDIYAQKTNSSGVEQWTAGGVKVNSDDGNQDGSGASLYDHLNPSVDIDGNGDAIVAWEEYRNPYGPDIYSQKLKNSNGDKLWPKTYTYPDTYSITGTMNYGRERYTSTLLANGSVLLAGSGTDSGFSINEIYNPSTGTYALAGTMSYGRYLHTSTLLPDGKVLLAGSGTVGGSSGYSINELYDPSTGTYTIAGTMNYNRDSHSSTLLANGSVLLAGASNLEGFSINEIYNPSTGTYTIAGTMNYPRYRHSATFLANGRVLLVGSVSYSGYSISELYDPSTGTYTITGTTNYVRYNHASTNLSNGKVLLEGAITGSGYSISELYDPSTGTYTIAGTMNYGRRYHTSTLLANDKVLLAGANADPGNSINEIYDPSTGTYTIAGTMNYPRYQHSATFLTNGQVLLTGSGTAVANSGFSISERYDTSVSDAGTYSVGGTVSYRRYLHTSTLLANGKVLLAGTNVSNSGQSISELYDPATGTFTISGTTAYGRRYHTSTPLANGKVLLAGTFETNSGQSISELYDPTTGTFTISGTTAYERRYHTSTLLANGRVLLAGSVGAEGRTISELFDPATGTFTISGTTTYRRYDYTSTLLANGKVLLAGTLLGNSGNSISELYDPTKGTFTITGTMTYRRRKHTSTLLANGKVLLAGTQYINSGQSISELYDPSTGTYTITGTMTYPRYTNISTLLSNGKVLLAGTGESNSGQSISELYDPGTGTFTISATTTYARDYSTSTLLTNGKVLLAGTGYSNSGLSISELYTPEMDIKVSNDGGAGNWDGFMNPYYPEMKGLVGKQTNPKVKANGLDAYIVWEDDRYAQITQNQVSFDYGTSPNTAPVYSRNLAATGVGNGGGKANNSYGAVQAILGPPKRIMAQKLSNYDGVKNWGDNQEDINRNNPEDLILSSTGDTNSNPDIALNGTDIILTWDTNSAHENENGTLKRESNIYTQKFNNNGKPAWGQTFEITGTVTYERYRETSTLLQNGKVLLIGTNFNVPGKSISELYDPSTGTFTIAGTTTYSRSTSSSILLPTSGNVLVTGSTTDLNGNSIPEIYDPTTGTFTIAGTTNYSRSFNHTLTALPNGRVLIIGGTAIATISELYDPTTGTFTITGTMAYPRYGHSSVLLSNGKVLVVGNGILNSALSISELYDPTTGTFTIAGTTNFQRRWHTSALLHKGKVLIIGSITAGGQSISELYDPIKGTFEISGTTTYGRENFTTTLLSNGKVLVIGSSEDNSGQSISELYDPYKGIFTIAGTLTYRRDYNNTTLLTNGKILIYGFFSSEEGSSIAELYSVDRMVNSGVDLADQSNPQVEVSGDNLFYTWQGVRGSDGGGGGQGVGGERGGIHYSIFGQKTDNPLNGNLSNSWPDETGHPRGTYKVDGTMTYGRDYYTSILLTNGKVLLAGSNSSPGYSIGELYDPSSGTYTIAGTMTYGRNYHTSTLLANGKVLLAGSSVVGSGSSINELFDPSSGTYTIAGTMTYGRDRHTSTLLANGKVLLAGSNSGSGFSINELFDPSSGTYTIAGTMTYRRYTHTSTLLPDGRVLLAGSGGGSGFSISELYDPSTGTYTLAGTMTYARRYHTSTLLANGKVLLAGTGETNSGQSINELYDPSTGAYTLAGTMTYARRYHTSTLLANGKALLVGAWTDSAGFSVNEFYDPSSGTYTIAGTMNYGRNVHTSTLLSNGRVLLAGSSSSSGSSINELFNPEGEMLLSHDFAIVGDQTNPSITVDSSGDPIIAWQDNRPAVGDFVDTAIKRDWDIYMQKYDSTTGSPLWPAADDPGGYDSPYSTMDIRVDTYRGDYGEHYSGKPIIGGIDSSNNIYINWEDNRNVTGAASTECGYSNTDSEVRVCGQKFTLDDQTTEKDVNWYVKFYASNDSSPNITVNTNIAEWDGYQKAAINSGTQTFTGCAASCATPTLQTLAYTDGGSPGPPSDTVGNITMRRLMIEYTWNSGGAITISYDDSGVDSRLDIGAQGTTDSIDSSIVSGVTKNISTIADSSYNVHVVYIDDKATDEVAYKKWNGTIWDVTPQTIDTSNDNAYVSLSYEAGADNLYTVYARSTSLYYKTVANGNPWSGASENNLATTGTNTNVTSSYSSAAVFAQWTVGDGSPYHITTNVMVVPELLWLFMPVGVFLPLLLKRKRNYANKLRM